MGKYPACLFYLICKGRTDHAAANQARIQTNADNRLLLSCMRRLHPSVNAPELSRVGGWAVCAGLSLWLRSAYWRAAEHGTIGQAGGDDMNEIVRLREQAETLKGAKFNIFPRKGQSIEQLREENQRAMDWLQLTKQIKQLERRSGPCRGTSLRSHRG